MPSHKPSRSPKRRHDAINAISVADHELYTSETSGRKRQRTTISNGESIYERQPRRTKEPHDNRLPVKTEHGWRMQHLDLGHEPASSSSEASESDAELSHVDSGSANPPSSKGSTREEILAAKEELAKLAARLNEDPEEHIGTLRAMSELSHSHNVIVRQLSLATLCSVYKDLIPGYRIRPSSAADMTEKVSKDVKKLRSYEQSLVGSYKIYVQRLTNLAKAPKASQSLRILATTALSCACTLLLAVPHFNFRSDLLKVVIDATSRPPSLADHELGIRTLQQLFEEDEEGRASLEAVQMLSKVIKARNFRVTEDMLNLFLHLRLLSEFGRKASHRRVDREEEERIDAPKKVQRLQAKRHFQTKRTRKLTKERRMLEKEMEEADAIVGHEERDKIQAEMLKLVFVCYFRILQAKDQHLMGAVLEGLARYAHLINQDFFADILQALRELISASHTRSVSDDQSEEALHHEDSRDASRESLLCIVTSFALLQGQEGKAVTNNLHLDLSFFVTELYRTILPVSMDADLEWSVKSLHLPDPLDNSTNRNTSRSNTDVNVKTKTVLLIRCLSSVLLPASALRAVPLLRLAAFSKQLMTIALQLPEKSCQAMLGLIAQTAKVHGKKIGGLWRSDERRGDGVFDPIRGDVEGSNPFSTTIWEGEILRLHYSPKVKEALKSIESNIRAAV